MSDSSLDSRGEDFDVSTEIRVCGFGFACSSCGFGNGVRVKLEIKDLRAWLGIREGWSGRGSLVIGQVR